MLAKKNSERIRGAGVRARRVGRPLRILSVGDPKASRTPGGGVGPEGSTPRLGEEGPRGEENVESSPRKVPICLVCGYVRVSVAW